MATEEHTRSGVRVVTRGTGESNVATGVPVLDHLLSVLARYASLDLALEVAPGAAVAEAGAAGRALGEALHAPLRDDAAAGYGSVTLPAAEALAHVSLEASDAPLLVSNVDLSEARFGGAGTDLVALFLRELTEAAAITLHVRLLEGRNADHVLEAIFKGFGVALAQALRPGFGKG